MSNDRKPDDPQNTSSESTPDRGDAGPANVIPFRDPNAGKSTPETQKAMLKEALRYAARGMYVFPSPPGTKKSYKCARRSNGRPWGMTDNAVEIRRDWKSWSEANVCIVTGPNSGYFVLEVDTPQGHDVDGFASLKALEDANSPLPETRQAMSPSGSVHSYYNWPATGTIKNSASEIGPGIDIRGEGGMVVAPPSLKPGVGVYKWINEHAVVDAPQWLLDLVVDSSHDAEPTPKGEAQANIDLVAAAMAVLPNDRNDWERWNKVGMACWAATGGHELGLEVFDNWSQKNTAKFNKANTRAKWKAYTESTPITDITAGSIFWWASAINPDWRSEYEATLPNILAVIKHASAHIDADATRAEEVLANANMDVFEYSGALARPITKVVAAAKGQKTVIVQLEPITQTYIRRLLNRCIRFESFTKQEGWVKCGPPKEIADAILDNKGNWKFEEIVGVISTQTMRSDGSLLLNPGYDKETQLLLVEPPQLPEIKEHPTRADALEALATLEDLLTEFPFVDDISHSVALSALISPVVRGAFEVVPMHAASAPKRSSGKSYLFDLVAGIAIGERMPVISAGANEEETEKRLGTELMTGQPLISIDNVNGMLKSDALCQIIERPTVDIRILGLSKRVRIQARGVSMFANGKNIVVYDDLTRRVIKILLDSKMERPELRQFTSNPFQKVLANRGAYIAACLTICRAYFVAGRPDKAPVLASFEGWSNVVRSALIWLGKADPVLSMEAAHADDPVHAELHSMLHAVADVIGVGKNYRFTLRDVIDICAERTDDYSSTWRYLHLNDAVQVAAGRKGRPADTSSLGYWMRRNKEDVVDNLRFVGITNPHGVAEWWIEDIAKPARPQTEGSWTKARRERAEVLAERKAKEAAAAEREQRPARPVSGNPDDDPPF